MYIIYHYGRYIVPCWQSKIRILDTKMRFSHFLCITFKYEICRILQQENVDEKRNMSVGYFIK